MIAVSEAHDSGLCGAGAVVRQRFASDLDNLTLAAPDLNRHEKRDHDAAEWLPENDRYWFAAAVAEGVDRPGQIAIKNAERAIYASATAFVAEAAGVRRCARRRHCEQYGSREGFAGKPPEPFQHLPYALVVGGVGQSMVTVGCGDPCAYGVQRGGPRSDDTVRGSHAGAGAGTTYRLGGAAEFSDRRSA